MVYGYYKEVEMKIIFFVPDFNTGGGITSSLRNLSNLLVKKGHVVDVFNLAKKPLPSDFDKRINLIEPTEREKLWNLSPADIKHAKGFRKIRLLLLSLRKKLTNKNSNWLNYVFKKSDISGYDVSVGFRQAPNCYYIASKVVKAKKSIGFWHGDIDYMGDISSWEYALDFPDKIACVSSAVGEGVLKRYPHLKGKICTVYNVFDAEKIKDFANELVDKSDKFNIVTVSRIDFKIKGIGNVIEIAKLLRSDGVDFCWTIVGGGEEEKLKKMIEENDLTNYIRLIGKTSNPYKYLKNADLTVSTSKTESFGMAVVESLICGTPVVAGEYPALKEILMGGKTGIIAENSVDGIYKSIKNVLDDKALYNSLKENAKNFKYDEMIAYNQFMEMVK